MPDKKQADDAVLAAIDRDLPEAYPDLAADSAPGVAGAGTKRESVVMTARRPWSIGQSIGLSHGYTFVPGVAIEVTAEDARILCGREWDERRFRRAGG